MSDGLEELMRKMKTPLSPLYLTPLSALVLDIHSYFHKSKHPAGLSLVLWLLTTPLSPHHEG